jgi:hypothetical protein
MFLMHLTNLPCFRKAEIPLRYVVPESKVETAKGKGIIRKYESTFDSQKVYAALTDHHLNSTKASLNSTKILRYITSAKIGDGSWHGTTENFVLSWQEQSSPV